MIVGGCFPGDVDMALAGVQRDLYFASSAYPEISIGGSSTLGWIWTTTLTYCAELHGQVPWVKRNLPRLRRLDGFNHKILQVPHEHIAAYFRWTMPRVSRRPAMRHLDDPYPYDLLDRWREFLMREIPDLLSRRDAAVALATMVLYDNFDFSDQARDTFHRILFQRYGLECLSKTRWAPDMAARLGVAGGPGLDDREGARA